MRERRGRTDEQGAGGGGARGGVRRGLRNGPRAKATGLLGDQPRKTGGEREFGCGKEERVAGDGLIDADPAPGRLDHASKLLSIIILQINAKYCGSRRHSGQPSKLQHS